MKKIIRKIFVTLVILNTSSHAIPVIDASQLYENGQTIARWIEQGNQWKKEIDQWQDQYDAVTKFRLDGSILDKFTQINNKYVFKTAYSLVPELEL